MAPFIVCVQVPPEGWLVYTPEDWQKLDAEYQQRCRDKADHTAIPFRPPVPSENYPLLYGRVTEALVCFGMNYTCTTGPSIKSPDGKLIFHLPDLPPPKKSSPEKWWVQEDKKPRRPRISPKPAFKMILKFFKNSEAKATQFTDSYWDKEHPLPGTKPSKGWIARNKMKYLQMLDSSTFGRSAEEVVAASAQSSKIAEKHLKAALEGTLKIVPGEREEAPLVRDGVFEDPNLDDLF